MSTAAKVQAKDIGERAPVAFMNYRANVVAFIADVIEQHLAMGPNTLGERLFPVSAEYDAATGITRVGFSYRPPVHRIERIGVSA